VEKRGREKREQVVSRLHRLAKDEEEMRNDKDEER